MKVFVIGPAWPYRGGIADTNESLCRALQAAGHDASIITFTMQYPELLFPGKTQYSADPKPANTEIRRMVHSLNPLNWIKTARYINRQKPDLVIVRYWLPFLSPCLGTIARFIDKSIVKAALCDNIIPHEKKPGDKLLTQYFLKPFDGFVTLSKAVLKDLDLFTSKPKIYFPHPINDNLGEKTDKQTARKYLNLEPDGKYILFFGLVRKYKGLDLLLKAMGEQNMKKSGIKLIVAGEFYDDPEIYHNIIKEEGIEDSVIIRNEFIPTGEIKYYFSAVDLITQTYHTATQSGVTQIAYHFDKPILVTRVGGLSETVLHNKTGYVTEKSPQSIAGYILDFYIGKREEEFTENVRKEKEKYSWNTFVKEVEKLYGTLKNTI